MKRLALFTLAVLTVGTAFLLSGGQHASHHPGADHRVLSVSSSSYLAAQDAIEREYLLKARASRERRVVQPAPTPTRTARRAPRRIHLVASLRPRSDGSVAWAASSAARAVVQCESGGNPRAVNGRYEGRWQMDSDFWRSYGGLAYASSPLGASGAEQDAVAYRGWLARGWEPWTCARIVGVR